MSVKVGEYEGLVAQILSKVAVIFWSVRVSYLSSVVNPRADECHG